MISFLLFFFSCSTQDCSSVCFETCERILDEKNQDEICERCSDAPSVPDKTGQCYQWTQQEIFSDIGYLYSECYCAIDEQEYPFDEQCDELLDKNSDICELRMKCFEE